MMSDSTWRGFRREDFTFEGHDCILVHPDKPREDRDRVENGSDIVRDRDRSLRVLRADRLTAHAAQKRR